MDERTTKTAQKIKGEIKKVLNRINLKLKSTWFAVCSHGPAKSMPSILSKVLDLRSVPCKMVYYDQGWRVRSMCGKSVQFVYWSFPCSCVHLSADRFHFNKPPSTQLDCELCQCSSVNIYVYVIALECRNKIYTHKTRI